MSDRRCVVCGDIEWLIGVAYDHPLSIVFFCPRCIPEEFAMVKKELPIHTPEHLRVSWINLHDRKCPYSAEQKDRAERRMYVKAKEFGITLPKMSEPHTTRNP